MTRGKELGFAIPFLRRDFSKIRKIIDFPSLVEIQKRAFESFLQSQIKPEQRTNVGLQGVLKSVFPIKDYNGNCSLEFVEYQLEPPRYDLRDCLQRGMTHAAAIKLKVRLIVWDVEKESGVRSVRDIKEQEVYFGEIPIMTPTGTFVINGVERVVVSQLHRSQGVFFELDKSKRQAAGRYSYTARLIPDRGSWIDLEFDHRDIMYARIDRKRKLPVGTLMRAFDFTNEELLQYFYDTIQIIRREGGKFERTFRPEQLIGTRSTLSVRDPKSGQEILRRDQKITPEAMAHLAKAGIKHLPIESKEILASVLAEDLMDPETGSLKFHANEEVNEGVLEWIVNSGIKEFQAFSISGSPVGAIIRNTLNLDRSDSVAEAHQEIYRRLRPGEPPTPDAAAALFQTTFLNQERYDLSAVGRLKINHKLQFLDPEENAKIFSRRMRVEELRWRKLRNSLGKLKSSGASEINALLSVLEEVTQAKTREWEILRELGQFLAPKIREVEPEVIKQEEKRREQLNQQLAKARKQLETLINQLRSRREKVEALWEAERAGETKGKVAPEVTLARKGLDRLDAQLRAEQPLYEDLGTRLLRSIDLLESVRYLAEIRNGRGALDDIDHLGNRRVRTVGELLENQYRIGLLRMERAIRERMSFQDVDALMPQEIVNPKPISAVIKEFFGSSQLSQFSDQTNPLSEITHKRRLSALGPGGLTRERAGFEVRDVHSSHYGRICPIETPEGPNIGLISSLSTFARVNDYGFIETPYRIVDNGRVSDRITFLTAMEEEEHRIAQANAPLDSHGRFQNDFVSARHRGEFALIARERVDLMDVSPSQLVSVAASLIPFLEHDDANRALMGSNMQRQAVPLMACEAPLVGTGMEASVARDSGFAMIAQQDGVVESVDASRIVLRSPEHGGVGAGVEIYPLVKYWRSNQNTCIHQKPIVRAEQKVRKGDVIADGPAISSGELALGKNVLVAFMPWGGYNFEDSILISEKLLKEDIFSSIHIEEFEVMSRDTKLGPEEFTRDIPNVGEESLKNLDEAGVIRIGTEVGPGEILVGKITPKGETQLSPEEKLLRAIFGEKAADVRDTSLRVPPGVTGTVIGVRIFSRKGMEKDPRAQDLENQEIAGLLRDRDDKIRIIEADFLDRTRELIVGRTCRRQFTSPRGKSLVIKKGEAITAEKLDRIPWKKWNDLEFDASEEEKERIKTELETLEEQIDFVRMVFEEKVRRLKRGDELPPGVIAMVKAYLAIKRKLSVGDKMAGRHGNKGVLSRILPEEDMPYLPDGTPVGMVLNPLGVPSRMNVGQILETHLGWACKEMGEKFGQLVDSKAAVEVVRTALKKLYKNSQIDAVLDKSGTEEILALGRRVKQGLAVSSPVFDGASELEIKALLKQEGLPESGKMALHDGRTGQPFDFPVTVGHMYMMKLHHLVDEKIHARSIGPYSLVTQQPLGGKAHFGGQRLGEMEVWAMEAYGAAYTLQEFLTVKSDDVTGRTRMYESIVKGEPSLEPGVPESFKVLIKELQSLGMNMELLGAKENQDEGYV
jgi:DNA-directed RNA polymerase subunit beta